MELTPPATQKEKSEIDRLDVEKRKLEKEEQRLIAEEGKLKAEENRLNVEVGKLKAEENRLNAETHKLNAEKEKLNAEKEKLNAEKEKLRDDNNAGWRVAQLAFPPVLAAIVAAFAAYVALDRESNRVAEQRREEARKEAEERRREAQAEEQRNRDEVERQFRRWRSLTGRFEIQDAVWDRQRPWNQLPPCETITSEVLRSRHLCGDENHPFSGVLCRVSVRSDSTETKYRRVRCWVSFPADVQFPEADSRSYTASIGGFDFDLNQSNYSLTRQLHF